MSGAESKNLSGRTVMVTRPLAQSGEITSLLEQLGAKVIHCPTIQVVEPSDWTPLDEAIDSLHAYDWAVFTSANGVRFFFDRLRARRSSDDLRKVLSRLRICAIGPATAKALEEAGARADLTAKESRAEGALQSIIDGAGGSQQVRGLRFLIPRANIARDLLPARLGELGAQVDAVEAYRTIKPEADGGYLSGLFKEGRIDAITFTSPSTVANFAALVGADDLSELLSDTVVGCIGPVTSEAARRFGLRDIVEPQSYTATALVEALAHSLVRKR